MRRMHWAIALAIAVVGAAVFVACSNGTTCANPGGAVSGATDMHCVGSDGGAIVQEVTQASCTADAAPPEGGGNGDYGPTMPNSEGDDDDCKYHVTWTSSQVCDNAGATFTVVATRKTDGTPLTGAAMQAEVFLSTTHPSPTPFVTSVEGPPGTYVTQPAKFNAPGQWTLRFHFFEDCEDNLDDSPHGHAAFYVNVNP